MAESYGEQLMLIQVERDWRGIFNQQVKGLLVVHYCLDSYDLFGP